MAPVIRALNAAGRSAIVVSSSQHKELLAPFREMLGVRVDHDFGLMRRDQGPNDVCSRVISKLDGLLDEVRPDAILVQGDTTTTLAGAIAGFNRRIPVGHVEAGLRSGNTMSPFPEEMNRRLVTRLASFHFAATEQNRTTLLAEGVSDRNIFVTGNPVVDSLRAIAKQAKPGRKITELIRDTAGTKLILLTTHRRESFGEAMTGNLKALRRFLERHSDVSLVFPVHPNPNVRRVTNEILAGTNRVHLLEPLAYPDFIGLMRAAWLIVSDSGGVQEEAPSLGKPLLVIRENTERPEAIESGVAKLVGRSPKVLGRMLEENYRDESWVRSVRSVPNPFGDGKAAARIARVLRKELKRR